MTAISGVNRGSWLLVLATMLPAVWTSAEENNAIVPPSPDCPYAASVAVDDQQLLNPINSPVEVHQVIVTVEQMSGKPDTPRHVEEKKRLDRTIAKPYGALQPNHPRRRLLDALYGFTHYKERQSAELDRLKGLYQHTTKAQKSLLERHVNYSQKFTRISQVLTENQELCDRIVDNALNFYQIPREELQKHIKDAQAAGKQADKIAVSQALKHFVRDWTETGLHEREKPFKCLLETIKNLFLGRDAASPVKVLLPGAGLGRLGYEIANLEGFEVTINEWSMYMNAVYRFLESHRAQNSESIYPFIDGWSHHATEADMHRKLSFPDVKINASSVLMVEGDFTTAFQSQPGGYDVVVTYFFIDTARNLMSYFDTIKHVLKPGGHWINLGPLLYGTGPFVQLTMEEIVLVSEAMGFQYLDTDDSCGDLTFNDKKVRGMEAIYGFDDRALTKNAYNAQFWVAKRL